MRIPGSLKSELSYSRKLFEAGLDAAATVRDGAPDHALALEMASAARKAWAPAVIGAALGFMGVYLARRGRFGHEALLGGVVGAAFGFGGGVAWSSREVTAVIARQAGKNVSAVRDAHWLEKNPIAYA